MCDKCKHITTYAQAAKGDPTRTSTLRNRFVKDVNRRFNKLKKDIYTTIVTNDAFGLNIQTNTAAGPNAFAFNSSAQKVDAFMEWLKVQINDGILEVKYMNQLGAAAQQPWTNMYIQDSYARGQARAAHELTKLGIKVPPIEETGGIRAAFGGPFHMDRVGLLYSRTFQELKNITAAMDSQISRVLSQAMADGDGPLTIARKLIATIDGKGTAVSKLAIKDSLGRFIPAQRRAQTMARTEMIRAHHQATIQEYENWGIEGVNVKAEWSTAGDDRVCELCAPLEGRVWPLAEARSLIPRHPNCFIDTQTPIYTSTGWKSIGKVEIGDLVLTHKNRFRKVYALPRTPKQKPEVTKFKFKGDLQLSMTSNHQVLQIDVNGIENWVQASEIKEGQSLRVLANRCKRCGKLIPYFNTYCSKSCNSLDITDKQWANPEHRKNVSTKNHKSMNEQYALGLRDKDTICLNANKKVKELAAKGEFILQQPETRKRIKETTNNPEHNEASSIRMKKNNPMFNPETKQKVKESLNELFEKHPEKRLNARMAKHRKSGKKTYIEARMIEMLDNMEISYVFQYPILRYNVDFAIPELKIVIECDGEYWHQDKVKEQKRDAKIKEAGWDIFHFTGSQINTTPKEVEDELARVLGNHTGEYETIDIEIEKVERWVIKQNRTLFNLSVEEDESYMAKGIVVHNCRCMVLPTYEKQTRNRKETYDNAAQITRAKKKAAKTT